MYDQPSKWANHQKETPPKCISYDAPPYIYTVISLLLPVAVPGRLTLAIVVIIMC